MALHRIQALVTCADVQQVIPRFTALQAGARIADVIDALRQHDLALQNIASIREQAMGGFVQVLALNAESKPHG